MTSYLRILDMFLFIRTIAQALKIYDFSYLRILDMFLFIRTIAQALKIYDLLGQWFSLL